MRIRSSVLLLLGAALLLNPIRPLPAAHAASVAHRPAGAPLIPLIVTITTTNRVVRGKVTIDYFSAGKRTFKTCSSARCRYMVPRGINVFLHQAPNDPRHWKFTYWTLTRRGADPQSYELAQPTTGLLMQASYRMSAQYVRYRR